MISYITDLATSAPGRLALVTAGSIIIIPALILLTAFLNRTITRLLRYQKNKNSLKHLPQHHIKGLGFYDKPNEDMATKVERYTKDPATGEMYDLVVLGPGIDGRQVVAVNDADMIQQMLTNPDAKEFPKSPVYEEVVADALLGDGLVTVTGLKDDKLQKWQFHRKLLTPLFHFKTLKDMTPMMTVYTKDLVDYLVKEGSSQWHHASDVLSRFTMSQIVYLAFGGAMDIDWLHKKQLAIGHGWTKYAALHTFFGDLVQYIPFTPAWEIVQLRRETEGAMYDVIKQVRAEGVANQTSQNLIATMLGAKDPKTGRTVSDKEIVEEACTMLFAGFDTTSTTMSWALYFLAKDPEATRWVQEELDNVLGYGASAREPTMEDLPNLKRTRAMINETLRLRPPLMSASRMTTRPTKLGNYEIPAQTIVNANIFLAQRNPKYWDKPNEFWPQRWEENPSDDADADSPRGENGVDSKKKRHPFSFIPFSAGARNCIGKNFAMQEMMIAMSMILCRFNVEYDPSKPFAVFGSPVPTPDVWLKFHSRW